MFFRAQVKFIRLQTLQPNDHFRLDSQGKETEINRLLQNKQILTLGVVHIQHNYMYMHKAESN